ncbi:MAG: septal ring lytic transglycosylase RlpA family protein [Pseudolabrys sp.]
MTFAAGIPAFTLALCLLGAPSPALAESARTLSSGTASVYSLAHSGRKTASGEIHRASEMTAAHRTLAFGTQVRVTNRRNGRSVVVRINDRGPFIRSRIIDLSPAAARALGFSGLAPVTLALAGHS